MLIFFECIHVVEEFDIPLQLLEDCLIFLQNDRWNHIAESIAVF
jgi:hypothetical protein